MEAISKTNTGRERTDLDRCYGKIGISAVVAALPYQSENKNPAYAPAEPPIRDRAEQMAEDEAA